jgi:Putative Ig domain
VGCILGKFKKTIATGAGFSLFLYCLGCGSGLEPTPNITQVLPQTITAGSQAMTLKITGTHFPAQATILWNGAALATTVVDANTLSSTVGSSNLANPATVQLKVRNTVTMQESPAAQVIIADPNAPPPSALTLSIATLPQGVVGALYNGSFSVTGGTSPYTWNVVSGQLPPGLSVAATTGAISGTPTSAGNYSFGIKVTDSGSSVQSATTTVSLPVVAAPATPTALTITSSSLPPGAMGTAYSASLQSSGGTAPLAWSITSGGLPNGLSLSATTGLISGTPTGSGTTNLTATIADSSNPSQTKSIPLTLVIAAPLSITASGLPSGTQSTSYSQALQASGGTGSYTWSISSGALPAGLSLSATTGLISGTPTVSGNFSIGVTVKDAGSPIQTAAGILALSVVAAGSPLAISTTSLSAGITNASFSSSLNATGGTAPYTWSVSGTLPAGLAFANTGTISGTPTAIGTTSPTFTVTDSSSPVQSKTTTLPITISAPALTITESTLPSGTNGTAYSSPAMAASGGTPAYTWSIAKGSSLPAGLTLAATTGIISGTPSVNGTFNLTVAVSDNGSPVQTATAATSIVVAPAPPPPGPGTTWYVRPDGGTRYSSNVTSGLCDGKGDSAPVGTTPNQHCAFNDIRYLWSDGSYNYGTSAPGWGWVIAGGDTVILRGSIATGVSYRVGWNSSSSYCDSTGCWGITGSPAQSGAPAPPSGTAGQHTRILGENYAACHSASAKTQLHGGWSTGTVLSLAGASNVDVACLDITDFSACGRSTQKVGCDSTQDFAQNGLNFSNTSTNITVTDVHIHGMATNGISGPTGDGVMLSYVDIIGNASAGWNADPGDGTTGVGSLLVQNFNIIGNGCAEQYPLVYPASNSIGDCTDQSSGGYGDGFGTSTVNSPAPGWQVHFDQGVVSYNTQDGLDALHISGPGSTMTDTRVLAYGNEGQQLKVGGATATIQDSVINGNCEAMTAGNTISPWFTSTAFNVLAAQCRAGNTAVLINVTPNDPATFQNNTLFSRGAIGLEVEYALGASDPANTLKYNNNIFVGFINSGNNSYPTPIYSNTDLNMLTNPGASWTNNAYFGFRSNWACPAPGESNAICTDPGLVDETYHVIGYGNLAPASGTSAVVGAGVAVPSITVDYTGVTRKNPPTIGAYEP